MCVATDVAYWLRTAGKPGITLRFMPGYSPVAATRLGLAPSQNRIPSDTATPTGIAWARRFAAEPVFIAVSTSSTMDCCAFGIAHPELLLGVLF